MNFRTLTCLLLLLAWAGAAKADTAIFAGGCFWCVEQAFQDVTGVTDAVSGFTGGTLENPTYRGNHRGHYEAVMVSYDSSIISYDELLTIFWRNIDPFDGGGQFCDRGFSYKSAVFYKGEEQRAFANASKGEVIESFHEQQVLTQLLPVSRFWPVEEAHQDYYMKNPIRYRFYKRGCGRAARLEQIWGEATDH